MIFLVTEFSRKTGDYGSLSLTDLKVLALTYMLEAQHVGTDHLSENPTIRATVEFSKPHKKASKEVDADGQKTEPTVQLVGFVHPKDDDENEDIEDEEDTNSQVRHVNLVLSNKQLSRLFWVESLLLSRLLL